MLLIIVCAALWAPTYLWAEPGEQPWAWLAGFAIAASALRYRAPKPGSQPMPSSSWSIFSAASSPRLNSYRPLPTLAKGRGPRGRSSCPALTNARPMTPWETPKRRSISISVSPSAYSRQASLA